MKQSIVALIRPKLNFGQKESEAAHLIEHILVAPKRLQKMGVTDDFYSQNIIFHSGVVNSFYLAEYYIVRSEVAEEMNKILLKHQNKLFLDNDEFEKLKSILVEETLENKGEYIDTGEQLAKVIYKPDSPAIRNPWNNIDSIKNLSYDKTISIFNKYNTDISSFALSFDKYKVDKIPVIKRNQLIESNKPIKLEHPWQSPGSVDTYLMARIPSELDSLTNTLYRLSLTDYRFGLLFDDLRNKKGLVYDISILHDSDINTLEIYFASSEANSEKVINEIKKSLEKYDDFIRKNLEHIKARLCLEIELDWGNIQNQALNLIDQVIFESDATNPASLIKKMAQIKAEDLCKFNGLFLDLLKNNSLLVKRKHGKEIKTE